MKIFIPQKAEEGLGGGWTFTRNIKKALRSSVEFVNDVKSCDLYFIPGATMSTREEVSDAKKSGRKIVLRIDNIPRNSRNRNTGTSRLYDFAQMADEVIYQSEWAREWIIPFIKKHGEVILNGTDTDIFKKEGDKYEKNGDPQYLYSRYNRDETKGWEKAWCSFQRIYFQFPKIHLWIVGQFSPEQKEYNFDLFGGAEKKYKYWGVIENPVEMAKIYRSADYLFVPYSMDACSNVIVEARMCGLEIIGTDLDKYSSANEILGADLEELTLESMGKKYLEVFQRACSK